MQKEEAHKDFGRVETAQRNSWRGQSGSLPPLRWAVYGDDYAITR